MDSVETWRNSQAERDLWESKGKRKVYPIEDVADLNRSQIRSHIDQSRKQEERRNRRDSDDSSSSCHSVDDVSPRTSSSSSRTSLSSCNSPRASSQRDSSSRSSKSNSSSSSSHSISRRAKKAKERLACTRTRFFDNDKEEVGQSVVPVGRYHNYPTTRASELADEQQQAAAAGGINFVDITEDRHEARRGQQEGNGAMERKSSWKRLRPRRQVSSIFNLSRTGNGVLSGQEVELMLVNVNMHQSPGPIRLVVNSKESVQRIIELALQAYDDQRRQPPLCHRRFILYCQNPEFEAMDEKSCIGDYDCRHFYLYPKDGCEEEVDTRTWTRIRGVMSELCSFKAWFEKSVAGIQYWGLSMLTTVGRNLGYVASSLYCLNLDSVIGSVVKSKII